MRIAMISTPFVAVPPTGYGGTELVVHELVEGLVRRGHQVTLFATGDSRTSAELRYLSPQRRWPPNPIDELNHVSWAMRQVREESFDLLHVHAAAALACSRFLPETPIVYTIHHVREEMFSSYYDHFQHVHYVAISADQAAREVPLQRLTVIHHGLDPGSYEWTETPAGYVGFIGRFAEIKGPHTAIDVAERAGVPIRVAGEVHPTDQEFAEREVLPRLERPHVRYIGSIGMKEKVPFFRNARALLMPITWNEPFGLVMIEAMLSGCPVVAFPAGSAPELVEEGISGFLVEDQGAMAELIRPGGPLDRFDRRRCRDRATERFSSARMVTRHERLYQHAAGTGGAADAPSSPQSPSVQRHWPATGARNRMNPAPRLDQEDHG